MARSRPFQFSLDAGLLASQVTVEHCERDLGELRAEQTRAARHLEELGEKIGSAAQAGRQAYDHLLSLAVRMGPPHFRALALDELRYAQHRQEVFMAQREAARLDLLLIRERVHIKEDQLSELLDQVENFRGLKREEESEHKRAMKKRETKVRDETARLQFERQRREQKRNQENDNYPGKRS